MRATIQFLMDNWRLVVTPAAIFGGVMVAGWMARRVAFQRLGEWAGRTKSDLDDILAETLHGPVLVWVAIGGLYLASKAVELPARAAAMLGTAFLVLWVVSLTVALAKLAGLLIKHKGRKVEGALPVTTVTQTVAQLVVTTGGLLILLNTLGISITPILTALGVGGLAVALALQDTLSNLFAGFYLSLAGQVRTGDYVKLSSGEEGYVTDTTWRSTTLRALGNNLIVVPNAKLAQAIVTNFHLPEKRMSLLIPVGVSYDETPERVEAVLIDEALAASGEVDGLLAEPKPFVRFIPGFGESSLDFTLICQVGEFVDQYLVQHELRKRIFRRFREEGIQIPYPVRTLYVRHEGGRA